jgi:hypothetical protein
MEPRKIECELILAEIAEGKTPCAKHRYRCEDETKKDLKIVLSEGVDWIDLFEDTFQWNVFGNGK